MRKTKLIRLLSGILAVLMLSGGFSIVSGAASDDGGKSSFREIGGLTDVLNTIKYKEYQQRYDSYPNNAKAPIVIDVLKDYRVESTSSLNDAEYIKTVIRNKENLKKFFFETTKVNSTNVSFIEFLSDPDGVKADLQSKINAASGSEKKSLQSDLNTLNSISSIQIPASSYTEYALRLRDPKLYYEKYKNDAQPKYPSEQLTEEEEADLVILENVEQFVKDVTKKTVVIYENNPFKSLDVSGNPVEGVAVPKQSIYLPDHDAVGWEVHIPEGAEGYYNIVLEYYSIFEEGISKKSSIERSIYIDGAIPYYEATYVSMSKTYQNYVTDSEGKAYTDIIGNGGFVTDINGNEIRPEMAMIETWRTVSLQDSSGTYVEPLKFYFSATTEDKPHVLQLYAQREPMVLASITLVPSGSTSLPSYEEYKNALIKDGAQNVGADVIASAAKDYNAMIADKLGKSKASDATAYIKLEAEYPSAASDATIYPTNDRTSCITSPQHPSKQYLNTLGGSGSGDQKKWSTVGQWVRYEVTVPESGFYKIATRFSQTTLQGSFVSRTLRVQLAGETEASVPFAEAYRLHFDYADDWQVACLNNGATEFSVYLKEGTNYIELEANLGDMSDIILRVTESLNNINDAYIKFLMLAGSNPDADRDYGFNRRLPESVRALRVEAANIYAIAEEIIELTGNKGSHVATLEKVAQLLERMGDDEDEIAGNLGNLKSNLGTLGTWISDSKESPLELDYIAICPGNASEDTSVKTKLPKATPNIWETLVFEVRMFIASFTSDYNTLGLMEEVDEDDSIIVWTTTGRDQANIIRSMVNNDFTKNYGVAVSLKLVAGGSLLPSVLAGVGPDVSMGHGSSDAINWAIRSALVEVTNMGTEEYCAENGYDYDPFFDAHVITGWQNVVADFHNDKEDATVADLASFSASAVIPMTLHEVITKESYDKLSDEEKADKDYQPYDVKYYFDIDEEEYEDVDRYEKKHYTAVEVNGKTMYRRFITTKEYEALSENDKKAYTKGDVEYYERFSLWGLPQEQTFNMMFYRADIFNELGIEPPKTWDDLYAIIGVLQSNNMEIAMPTSLGGLQMFLYQMGGDQYSNGGQTISFDENLSISAFELLCNFFQSYKFPVAYDFSNRFRSGEIPMGIMAYTSYTQLSVFATEIKGMWEFVPLPGYRDPVTGDVNNDSTSGSSGIIMLKGARDRNVTYDAWKFMVWFTSSSAQTNYASEVTAVLGTESKHPTANKKSLYELPWTSSERDNLAEQFDNLVGIPEYPGSYIIGRYVNFAFLDVYNNNADPVVAIQEYVVTINAELTRKRQEFGLAYKEITYSNS